VIITVNCCLLVFVYCNLGCMGFYYGKNREHGNLIVVFFKNENSFLAPPNEFEFSK
jgi:hypothetical protein